MSRVRVWRRRLVAIALVAVVVFAGYMLWLRNASWFSVDEVRVDGATANRDEVTGALAQAAAGMTTLHIRDDELREAVSGFPTIASIKAEASFPHELHITVTERLPVAVAEVGGQEVPVSADGYVLAGVEYDAKRLPSLDAVDAEGPRLSEEGAAQAAIVGAAPEPLTERLVAASWDEGRGGVVVDLDGAPELRFGDGSGGGIEVEGGGRGPRRPGAAGGLLPRRQRPGAPGDGRLSCHSASPSEPSATARAAAGAPASGRAAVRALAPAAHEIAGLQALSAPSTNP